MARAKKDSARMSTFLEDGRVLLQIDYRYIVCDQNGNFQNEVQFDNMLQE